MSLRTVAVLRAMLGASIIVRPKWAATILGTGRSGRHLVLRVLGGRHLSEAAVLVARPTPRVARAARTVDAVHLASCLLLAAASRQHRRAALRDAGFASILIAITRAPAARHADQWEHRAVSTPPDSSGVPAHLVMASGGRVAAATPAGRGQQTTIALPVGRPLIIGRGRTADLNLADPALSPQHARIDARGDGRAELHDLDSVNGTCVNGIPIRTAELHSGDRIDIGTTTLVYINDA